jgi:hypothetical protein
MAESIPVTDYKSLASLRTKVWQDRREARSDLRPVYALDTETYEGNLFLIADSEGNWLDDISAENVIKFLFNKRYQGAWNFFYNLSYDAEVILKLLGESLNSYKTSKRLVFKWNDYRLEYIPSKRLVIRKKHHSSVFFDISQYYHSSLTDAYQNNIGKLSNDYLQMKTKRSEFSPYFYKRNKTLVRNYCVQDCKLTKELAEHWIKLFHDAFGFYPLRWISSGYVAEKVLINNKIDIPKFAEIPYRVQDLAWRSYYGGRFEILKRGFIGEAHLYDINSAYPYALTQIPDLRKGKWFRRKTILQEAQVGFFHIRASIPDCKYMPPFPFKSNNILIFPTGQFETYVTLAELRACENPKWYKILDSYQFVPNSDEYPYKDFVEKMYQKRLELKQKKDPLQLPLKVILNSIYGKTSQKVNGRIGNLFNPVIASFITGFTRAQLYQFIIQNNLEKETVAFATDSICITRKLDINSVKLGEFSLDNSANDVFYLQNGFYRFNGRWKQRGLGNLGSKEIEHLETIERKGKLYYKFKVKRSTRLRSSILQDSISNIGMIKEFEREMNLNADRKRLWLGELTSVDSKIMNDSMPVSFNYFSKDVI